jgi:hypothetical protein
VFASGGLVNTAGTDALRWSSRWPAVQRVLEDTLHSDGGGVPGAIVCLNEVRKTYQLV